MIDDPVLLIPYTTQNGALKTPARIVEGIIGVV